MTGFAAVWSFLIALWRVHDLGTKDRTLFWKKNKGTKERLKESVAEVVLLLNGSCSNFEIFKLCGL